MINDEDNTNYNDDRQEKFQRECMDVYAVRLTAWHARMARRIGAGNLGRGIRIAIEKLAKANSGSK
jgi:hypothetical protein